MFRRSLLALSLFTSCSALAHQGPGAASHAPLGVMGDHLHKAGEVMFSYRFMSMQMEDNRSGSQRVSTADVLDDFVVAPLNMDTRMHMLGMMYAPHDRITLMLMAPFVDKEMQHVNRMGRRFRTHGSGFGDVKGGALIGLYGDGTVSGGHLNLSVSAPTGSIDERDDNPFCQMNNACPARLPYPMQIGSGTWDAQLGMTHRQRHGAWGLGAQGMATLRLGRNDQDYSLGDRYELTAWADRSLGQHFSLSLRVAGRKWENVDGSDDQLRNLPAILIPTARPELRAGERLDLGGGLNIKAGATRFALEYLAPLYQSLEGPQLEADGMWILGWQYTPQSNP